jgi:hypothetical protein
VHPPGFPGIENWAPQTLYYFAAAAAAAVAIGDWLPLPLLLPLAIGCRCRCRYCCHWRLVAAAAAAAVAIGDWLPLPLPLLLPLAVVSRYFVTDSLHLTLLGTQRSRSLLWPKHTT